MVRLGVRTLSICILISEKYECVGGNVGLLALNALFILMQEYNLYVCRGQVLLFCTHNALKRLPAVLHSSIRLPRSECFTPQTSSPLFSPY